MKYKRNKLKKGFTLIELLAVIVILAIIALIATPRIMAAIEQARKEAFRNDVYGIVKAVERDYVKRILDEEKIEVTYEFNDYVQTVTPDYIDELAFTGRGPKNGTIIVDEDGNVDLALDDDKWCVIIVKGTSEAIMNEYVSGECVIEEGVITGPIYDEAEITNMITLGYIPVASADELNNVRYEVDNIFGSGTIWEDTYTGGLDKSYIQVRDINLSTYDNWESIGNSNDLFVGVYDGNGYMINNLTQLHGVNNYPEGGNHGYTVAGLFGRVEGVSLSNIVMDNISVRGSQGVGGLVGWSNSSGLSTIDNVHILSGEVIASESDPGQVNESYAVGGLIGYTYSIEISNCSVNVDVYSEGGAVGGLAGEAYESVISNSWASGNVVGSYDTGGFIGFGYDEVINNSYSIGNVEGVERYHSTTAPYYLGGFAGRIYGEVNNSYSTGNITSTYEGTNYSFSYGGFAGENAANINYSFATGDVFCIVCEAAGGFVGSHGPFAEYITNSYATGNVTGAADVGGFVGWLFDSQLSNSYSTGVVTSSGNAGGFAANNSLWGDDFFPENSYYDIDNSNQSDNGLGYARSTSLMKEQSTFVDFDFENIWAIDPSVNNGYPYLINNNF